MLEWGRVGWRGVERSAAAECGVVLFGVVWCTRSSTSERERSSFYNSKDYILNILNSASDVTNAAATAAAARHFIFYASVIV